MTKLRRMDQPTLTADMTGVELPLTADDVLNLIQPLLHDDGEVDVDMDEEGFHSEEAREVVLLPGLTAVPPLPEPFEDTRMVGETDDFEGIEVEFEWEVTGSEVTPDGVILVCEPA